MPCWHVENLSRDIPDLQKVKGIQDWRPKVCENPQMAESGMNTVLDIDLMFLRFFTFQ